MTSSPSFLPSPSVSSFSGSESDTCRSYRSSKPSLALQDYDKDGLLDRYERQVSLSDPENEDTDGDGKNDGDEVINYKTSPLVGKPDAADITNEARVVTGSVPLKEGAATQTAKVLDATGKVIGTSTVNPDGTFSVS